MEESCRTLESSISSVHCGMRGISGQKWKKTVELLLRVAIIVNSTGSHGEGQRRCRTDRWKSHRLLERRGISMCWVLCHRANYQVQGT